MSKDLTSDTRFRQNQSDDRHSRLTAESRNKHFETINSSHASSTNTDNTKNLLYAPSPAVVSQSQEFSEFINDNTSNLYSTGDQTSTNILYGRNSSRKSKSDSQRKTSIGKRSKHTKARRIKYKTSPSIISSSFAEDSKHPDSIGSDEMNDEKQENELSSRIACIPSASDANSDSNTLSNVIQASNMVVLSVSTGIGESNSVSNMEDISTRLRRRKPIDYKYGHSSSTNSVISTQCPMSNPPVTDPSIDYHSDDSSNSSFVPSEVELSLSDGKDELNDDDSSSPNVQPVTPSARLQSLPIASSSNNSSQLAESANLGIYYAYVHIPGVMKMSESNKGAVISELTSSLKDLGIKAYMNSRLVFKRECLRLHIPISVSKSDTIDYLLTLLTRDATRDNWDASVNRGDKTRKWVSIRQQPVPISSSAIIDEILKPIKRKHARGHRASSHKKKRLNEADEVHNDSKLDMDLFNTVNPHVQSRSNPRQLKVISVNINGLIGRLDELVEIQKEQRPHIIMIQESHLLPQSKPPDLHRFHCCSSSVADHPKRGFVTYVWHEVSGKREIKQIGHNNPYFFVLKVRDTLLINIHWPDDTSKHADIFNEISRTISRCKYEFMIIAGDFNLKPSSTLSNPIKMLSDQYELTILNNSIATRRSTVLTVGHVTDNVLVSNRLKCIIEVLKKGTSDHYVLCVTVDELFWKMKHVTAPPDDKSKYLIPPTPILSIVWKLMNIQHWNSLDMSADDIIPFLLPLIEQLKIAETADRALDLVRSAFEEVFYTEFPKQFTGRNRTNAQTHHRALWMNRELLSKRKDINARQESTVDLTEEDRLQLDADIHQYRKDKDHARHQFQIDQDNNLIIRLREEPSLAWKDILFEFSNGYSQHEVGAEDKSSQLFDMADNIDKMFEILESHFGNKPDMEDDITDGVGLRSDVASVMGDPVVTKYDLLECCPQLASGKSAGADGLTAEHIKAFVKLAGDCAIDLLVAFFNRLLELQSCPTQWTISVLVPIPKPGVSNLELASNVSNWRGISLLPVLSKLFMRILSKKIENHVTPYLCPVQAGFLKGRSCVEQTIVLKDVMARRWILNKETCVAFIDFAKAYDSIIRDSLWRSLYQIGIPPSTIALLRSYYHKTSSYIRVNDCWSRNSVLLNKGVRQGCPLSCILFDISIDQVMWKVYDCCKQLCALRDECLCAGLVAYADDIAIWSFNTLSMERLIAMLKVEAKSVGLVINVGKSGILTTINGLSVDDKIGGLPVVEKYIHLGTELTTNFSENYTRAVMKSKCGSQFKMNLASAARQLSYGSGSFVVRKIIADSLVLSKTRFGMEIWPRTLEDVSNFQRVLATICRLLLGIRTMTPCYKSLICECGYDPALLIMSQCQVRSIVDWSLRNNLIMTPIEELILSSKDISNSKLWTTSVLRRLEQETKTDFGDIQLLEPLPGEPEDERLLRTKDRLLVTIKMKLQGQELSDNTIDTTSSYYQYSTQNGTRGHFLDILHCMTTRPTGRRCVHELRIGCYPVMEYCRKVGWHLDNRTGCPFCNSVDEESVDHMIRTCTAWNDERNSNLKQYIDATLEGDVVSLFLGFTKSVKFMKDLFKKKWEDKDIIQAIVNFMTQVDYRRSKYLDYVDRLNRRGGEAEVVEAVEL